MRDYHLYPKTSPAAAQPSKSSRGSVWRRLGSGLALCSLAVGLLAGLLAGPVRAEESAGAKLDVQKLDQHFEKAAKAVNAPSVTVEIFDAEETLFSKSYGKDGGADAAYAIGSLSKSLTAVGVMQLVEAGKVNLNAPLSTYVKGASYGDQVTVKQLLNQDSGLPNQGKPKLGKQGQFMYSNSNYIHLGEIIEAVSGQSYPDYMRDQVFQPLGMDRTSADLDQSLEDGVLDSHTNFYGFNRALPFEQDLNQLSAQFEIGSFEQQAAAGYLSSSAKDMTAYLQSFLKKDSGLLSPATTRQTYEDSISLDGSPLAAAYPNHSYGYGWMVTEVNGERLVWHNGGTFGSLSYAFFLPDRGIGGIILMNKLDRWTSGLWHQNMLTVASYLAGGELKPIPQSSYWTTHLLLDGAYLLLLAIPISSLLRLKRFRRTLALGQRKKTHLVFFILLHVLLPLGLFLAAGPLMGLPTSVFAATYPDTWLVILGSIGLTILAGLAKVYIWRQITVAGKSAPAADRAER